MLKETEQRLNEFDKLVVKLSRTNLTKGKHKSSGDLYKNLQYDVSKDANGYTVIFEFPYYGEFLDKGVSGTKKKYDTPYKYKTKKPPYKTILEWVKQKKLRFRDAKGKFKAGNYKSIAAIMQNSIYKKGIAPTLFFTKPFEKHFKNLPDEIVEGLTNDYKL